MKDSKDTVKAVAAASAGAGVGGAGGATAGVLELAAQGILSGLSAGIVIGAGATIGALIGYGVFRLAKKSRTPKPQAESAASQAIPQVQDPNQPPQ